MPNIVACPKCGKKYKLPDSFSAQRVRCQACGADFAAQYDVSQLNDTMVSDPGLQAPRPKQPAQQRRPQQQRRQQQPTQRAPKPAAGASKDSLAQLGLSQIKQQPDLFSDDQSGGPDPLRNHVVQDPGFGNANATARAKQKSQPQPGASGGGDLEDVVSNPFMASTGSGSVDARRKKALKRKKEDELLAGYKTSSNSLSQNRGPSELSQNGITRTGFWLAHFFFNLVAQGIIAANGLMSQFQLSGEEPAAAPTREAAMAIGGLVFFGIFAGIAAVGFFRSTLVSLRFQNVRFKKPLWKKIAAYTTAAPYALLCLTVLLVLLTVLTSVPAFFAAAMIVGGIGILALLPSILCECVALVLPPDFGVHRKLDTASYIWIALISLPLLLLILLFCIGMVSALAGR